MAKTAAEKAARRAERMRKDAKTPNWALWLGFVIGMIATAGGVIPLGFVIYGAIGWSLAARKGRTNMWGWFLYAGLLLPIAFIHYLVMKPTPEIEFERKASMWATTPEQAGVCGYTDDFAPGPCLKPKGHHLAGIDRSPHDYRPQTEGSAF